MKNFIFISFLIFILGINACGIKPPEERLSEININEESYKVLPPCNQIAIFAEIGSEYIDIDHYAMFLPGWMYKEILNNPINVNSACVEQELSKNFLRIEQLEIEKSRTIYKNISLRIHSLFFLSKELGILKEPNINIFLKSSVCEENILYSQTNFLTYYFTQKDDLPDYINNSTPEDLPENMKKLKIEICENS
jgi:hypothetical protein